MSTARSSSSFKTGAPSSSVHYFLNVSVCPEYLSQGTLAGFDQKSNIVLADSKERVYSVDEGVEEIPLGLYLVKGEMMYVHLPPVLTVLIPSPDVWWASSMKRSTSPSISPPSALSPSLQSDMAECFIRPERVAELHIPARTRSRRAALHIRLRPVPRHIASPTRVDAPVILLPFVF